TALALCSREQLLARTHWPDGQGAVVFVGDVPAGPWPAQVRCLAAPGQARDYARALYANLRQLDQAGLDWILFEQPPATLAWQAVHDRLGRAAAAFGARPGLA